jgi:hypothetical protein
MGNKIGRQAANSEFEAQHPRDVNGPNKGQFVANMLPQGGAVNFDDNAAPGLTPPNNSARDAESVKTCLEAFEDVANDLGATSDISYGGRSVIYWAGAEDQLECRVWVNDEGTGFCGYGRRFTESRDFDPAMDIKMIDGADSRAAEKLMLKTFLEAHKTNRSEKWADNLNEDPEDSLRWECAKFSPEDAGAWTRAHFSAKEAIEWRECGFEPKDAKEWYDAGFRYFLPEEAKEWREAGFEPELAMEWQRMRRNKATTYPGSIEHMKEWSRFTLDPIEVRKWTNLFGTSDPKASQQWRDYGFTADEYELWQEFDPKTARAKRDAGVDVQTALAEPHERQNKWISSQ